MSLRSWGYRAGLVLAAAGLVALGIGGAAPARASARVNTANSGNWSGYNVNILQDGLAPVTSVSATWTVPKVSQMTPGQAENSAAWVGIGGGCLDPSCTAGDATLIQAGTDQSVDASGNPTYSAWWEIVPAPSIPDFGMTISPGDSITVVISQGRVPETWDVTISNNTTGQTDQVASDQSVPLPYPSDYTTADYIFESPLVPASGGFASLPKIDSGPITFDDALLNGRNPGLNASEAVHLVDGNNNVQALPSAPDSTGDGFNVCANAVASCPAPIT